MPLELGTHDVFDDVTHQKLDEAVNDAVSDAELSSHLASISECIILLIAIITYSNGDLDPKYLNVKEAKNLVKQNEELQSMLATAWKHKSYCDIRNLVVLKKTRNVPGDNLEDNEELYLALSRSFKAQYRGAAIEGFHEYLTQNEILFNKETTRRYYAKFCSIVQSSGTGKTRMLTELWQKDVVVLYMNLREEGDVKSFPARDSIPASALASSPTSEVEYKINCYAFLVSLFEALEEKLSGAYTTRQAKENIINWTRQMCDMSHTPAPETTARSEFFDDVSKKYERARSEFIRAQNTSRDRDKSSNVDQATNEMQRLSLSENNEGKANKSDGSILKDGKLESEMMWDTFSSIYMKVGDTLKNIFPGDRNSPKLVIALDEAHPLTSNVKGDNKQYRPADVLCRIINRYSHASSYPIWVVFASTTSKVADFSPPNRSYNSDRVAVSGQLLFPPYTQLGWDQSAFALRDVPVENIANLRHIAGYGRPLWCSLITALKTADMLWGTASAKLCGGSDFNPDDTHQVLAVLGQRFGLNVTFGHPDAVSYLESGVASHLRICLKTTQDRNWRFTSYPSEPLLSGIAAMELHRQPHFLELALSTLLKAVNRGMIDVGGRGELASRLLWLLAKDLYLRTSPEEAAFKRPNSWDDHLTDCTMIPVVDWLEFVFGPQVWDKKNRQASLARSMFEGAYVNFSHWVCMDANIAAQGEPDALDLDECTLRYWQRTSAVQCCHQQPLVDKMIPIYFKGEPTSTAASKTSQIFISDKARESKDSKKMLGEITRRNETLGGKTSGRPYIAILADLGQPAEFSVTFPERDVDDRCLRIYAAGVDTITYPFMEKYPALMDTLRNLVYRVRMPEALQPYTQYLDAQVKFGSTGTARHMHWEHGKTVPQLERKTPTAA